LEQTSMTIAVGRAVRRQRQSQGLSQEALAALADVNRRHLSPLERGKHDPQATTLIKLARGLGLSCQALGAAIDEELERQR
jgi:transcriptional regulator with XRE-family HTH domain